MSAVTIITVNAREGSNPARIRIAVRTHAERGAGERGTLPVSAINHAGRRTVKIHIKIVEAENEYIANCPELDVNCYGSSRSDAVRRLVSVLQFYVDAAQEMGLDVERLDTVMIDGEKGLSPCPQEIIHQSTGSIH